MKFTSPIILAIIALLLLVYTYFFVDPTHYFVLNAGWDTNLIEARVACYLIAGLGFCLAGFYAVFSSVLYSERLISMQIIFYFLLVAVLTLWDNNIFSLQEVVDSNAYNTLGEVKSEYKNVIEKDHTYRVLFWILLCLQTIGLLNLILGFFKSNKD